MELKLEIICKEFIHKKSINKRIIVKEENEEYYVIPLNDSFDMETDGEIYKLIFKNQLLWLKYSTKNKDIYIKEFDFKEFIVIKSEDIYDIFVNVHTTNYFRRNVWQTSNTVPLNKKYLDKYILVLPIFEDMIDIKEFGIGIVNYQIHMNTNEILLKKATSRAKNSCNLVITNNVMLNKEALFIPLNDKSLDLFLP